METGDVFIVSHNLVETKFIIESIDRDAIFPFSIHGFLCRIEGRWVLCDIYDEVGIKWFMKRKLIFLK